MNTESRAVRTVRGLVTGVSVGVLALALAGCSVGGAHLRLSPRRNPRPCRLRRHLRPQRQRRPRQRYLQSPATTSGSSHRFRSSVFPTSHSSIRLHPHSQSMCSETSAISRGSPSLPRSAMRWVRSVAAQNGAAPVDAWKTVDDQLHVFDELARAGNARDIAGFGIGLTLVATVLRRHGGGVALRSAEGAGTVVTLHLPVHAPQR